MFFITALPPDGTLQRCFGYKYQETDARIAVEKNEGNMHECLYEHIVIEKIRAGIHPIAIEVQWYVWENDKWIETTKPIRYVGIVNFALG